MRYAKAYAAFTGAVLTAVMGSSGFAVVPESWRPYFALVLSVATAVATFTVPNTPVEASDAGDVVESGH